MNGPNYWQGIVGHRIARRRALAMAGSTALGAALLAACGSSGSGDKQAASSLITKSVDTSKQAKQGGLLKLTRSTDVQTFMPFLISRPSAWHQPHVYSRLIRPKPGYLSAPTGEVEPDLAESYEVTPEQMVFKIRQNAHFDPRPPTNGRLATAEDWVFSWNWYGEIGGRRADFYNSINSAAPVISMTAPNPQTVVAKMAFPDSSVLLTMSSGGGKPMTLPREADGGFDARREFRGSGPFIMTNYTPSVGFTYARNPGFWEKSWPYVENISVPIVTEYATALAQFKTGGIYLFDELRSEDVLQTKRDVPALSLYQSDVEVPTARLFYGFEGGMAKSPFVDERVRQAYSMAMERDLFIDTFYNVKQLESQGLPVETRINTGVPASSQGWWLDPNGKDFGPNAKYYKHDLAEAKKLMAAAGFSNGLDVESHHIITTENGRDFAKQIEVMAGMAAEAGIRIKIVPTEFNNVRDNYANVKGAFAGVSFVNFTANDVGQWIGAVYAKQGSLFTGLAAPGQPAGSGDPFFDDLAAKINREFEPQKRWAMAHELQRYEAKTQYVPPFLGGASGFELAWPAVENYRVSRTTSDSGQKNFYLWLNDQKAPIAKA